MNAGIGRSCFAVQPGNAVVGRCTGLFTIVAANAKAFIDQQHIGCLAQPLVDQEVNNGRGMLARVFARHILHGASGDRGFDFFTQSRVLFGQCPDPNDEFGEEVKAAVKLADGHQPSPQLSESLIEYCREHLAHYKAPRSVDFEDEFPRHETGKLYKRLLRDQYWQNQGRSI